MRQQYLKITCDECGVTVEFETLRLPQDGPMVATTDVAAMIAKRGWSSIHEGLRQIDHCDRCHAQRVTTRKRERANDENATHP